MKRLAAALLCALTLPAAHAQSAGDEPAIRAVIAHEQEGWTKFNAAEVASCFTTDALWQNPFGVRLHGRAEILKFISELMTRPGFRAGSSTVPAKILDVRITSPTTATVWSDERIDGLINDNSGKPMKPRHSFYLAALVKQQGTWRIADEMIMDIVHPD